MDEALSFINLFFSGIVTGTYVFEMVVVVPGLRAAPLELSAQVHRVLFSHLPNRYMPLSGMLGGLSAPALLATADLTSAAQGLYIVGFVAWVATLVLLAGFSRPIDIRITGWARTSLPVDEYRHERVRWDRLMMARGPLGVFALACFIAAALKA